MQATAHQLGFQGRERWNRKRRLRCSVWLC
jgi:hypothetical protein